MNNKQIKIFSKFFHYRDQMSLCVIPLYAIESVDLLSKKSCLVSTGVYMEIPQGYEGELIGSDTYLRHQIFPLNYPGTIDSDYRGEIKVIAYKYGDSMVTIKKGDVVGYVRINKLADLLCNQQQDRKSENFISAEQGGVVRATEQSAGLDLISSQKYYLKAYNNLEITIKQQLHNCLLYQLRSRSGLAAKHQVISGNYVFCKNQNPQLNSIYMHNLSNINYQINLGDRVAQLVPLMYKNNTIQFYSLYNLVIKPKSLSIIEIDHAHQYNGCEIIGLLENIVHRGLVLIGDNIANNKIYCINNSEYECQITKGQILGNIYTIFRIKVNILPCKQEDLNNSNRAQGGFGSTGK